MNCPICQRQGISCSSIRLAETKQIELEGNTSGGGLVLTSSGPGLVVGGGRSHYNGEEQTLRAKLFVPPVQPSRLSASITRMLILFIFISLFGLAASKLTPELPDTMSSSIAAELSRSLRDLDKPFAIAVAVSGIFLIFWLIYGFPKVSSDDDHALATWENNIKIWDGLYYCEADDLVFDGSGQHCKSSEIRSFYNSMNNHFTESME